MLFTERAGLSLVFGTVLMIVFIAVYNKGVIDTERKVYQNYTAKENWKSACLRYKGLYIQSDFENKRLRTDSAKALRFTVTVYDNKY